MLRTGWGGGSPDGAAVLVVEVDGDRVGGDVDRDGLPGVDSAESDLLGRVYADQNEFS
jgi:hypothetical protein